MDHLFEQKLVRENQQLQIELTKLNKQIKQLQETVVGYEQMLEALAHTDVERTDPKVKALTVQQGQRLKGIASNLNAISRQGYKQMDDAQRREHSRKIERVSSILNARGAETEVTHGEPFRTGSEITVKTPSYHDKAIDADTTVHLAKANENQRFDAQDRANTLRYSGISDRRRRAEEEKRKKEIDSWKV